MQLNPVLIPTIFLAAWTVAYAGDTLEEYTEKCEQATGIKISDFDCDKGTEVPDTHPSSTPAKYGPGEKCDRPNQLNEECDPGSRFQVLPGSTDEVFAVAHCRKKGLSAGHYGDIAIIQHNTKNGATCFYQGLGDLDGQVKAPSKGTSAWPWLTPAATAGIGCGGCHDNGPIIRSPYLTQITDQTDPPQKNILPGAGIEYTFNSSGDPYAFVGTDFASWKAFEVTVTGNKCNECHRLGVSNITVPGLEAASPPRKPGTARDFGIRATAPTLPNKNPVSADSPMWMLRGAASYSQANADAAKEIKTCANRFAEGSPLPNSASCKITQFTGSKMTAVRWQGQAAYFFKVGQYLQYDTTADKTVASNYPASLKGKGLWASGIDAAILWGNGKAYFFRGKDYYRYDVATDKLDSGYPKPIAPAWPGVWADGIDAAVPWNNGKIYFFKGDQYIRYDVKADKADTGYPKPIKGNWPGLWEKGIDTGILWNDKKAYFFKGNQYIRYDVKTDKVDPGYPKSIKGNWPGLDW